MSAQGNLSTVQFGVRRNSPPSPDITDTRFDQEIEARVQYDSNGKPLGMLNHHPYHEIRAMQGPHRVGKLFWHESTGDIGGIGVEPSHRHQGLATMMFDRASEYSAENGLAIPQHSANQTFAGAGWADAEQSRSVVPAVKGQQPMFPRKASNKTQEL